jgi:hypothetical protein
VFRLKRKLLELGKDAFSEDQKVSRYAITKLFFLGLCLFLILLIIGRGSLKGIKRGIMISKSFIHARSSDPSATSLNLTCYEKATGINHCHKSKVRN